MQRVRIYDSTKNRLSILTLYPSDPKLNTLDQWQLNKADTDEFISDARSFQSGDYDRLDTK